MADPAFRAIIPRGRVPKRPWPSLLARRRGLPRLYTKVRILRNVLKAETAPLRLPMAKSELASKPSKSRGVSFKDLAALYEKRYSKMLDAMGSAK